MTLIWILLIIYFSINSALAAVDFHWDKSIVKWILLYLFGVPFYIGTGIFILATALWWTVSNKWGISFYFQLHLTNKYNKSSVLRRAMDNVEDESKRDDIRKWSQKIVDKYGQTVWCLTCDNPTFNNFIHCKECISGLNTLD